MTIKQIERIVAAEVARIMNKYEALRKNPAKSAPEWVDAAVVCDMLKVAKRTLDRYRCRGLIPYSKIGGKIFYNLQEISTFLEERQVSKPLQR